MRLVTRAREEPSVNLTSLIDVVFLLLIFFMVSTSFVKEADITLQLPEADREQTVEPPSEQLEIIVTADGNYWVAGRQLINTRRETLKAAILEVTNGATDTPVTLSADADARHQLVVTALDVAGKLGFDAVSISTVNLAAED